MLFSGMLSFAVPEANATSSVTGGTGELCVEVQIANSYSLTGNSAQWPNAKTLSYLFERRYATIGITLTGMEESGQSVAKSVVTTDGKYAFTGLADGEYYLEIDTMGIYDLLEFVYNGTSTEYRYPTTNKVGPIYVRNGVTDTSDKSIFPVGLSKPTVFWMLDEKTHDFITITDVGTFTNNTNVSKISVDGKNKDYYPDIVQDEGSVTTFSNGRKAIWTSAANVKYYSHSGIFLSESANQYTGMDHLEIPTLSADEKALGYYFTGWKDTKDDTVMDENRALSLVRSDDIILKALFELPCHSVHFVTDPEIGKIHDSTSSDDDMYFDIWGNVSMANPRHVDIPQNEPSYKVPTIDIVNDKYTFIGWNRYANGEGYDHKVYTNEEVKNTTITTDITWVAVYNMAYTVIYTDDVGRTAFEDQVYSNLKAGDTTPAYNGTPTREGYEFIGWNPEVAEKVMGDAIYFASWQPVYTVTYSDGVGGKVFADKVTTDLKYGDATPAFYDIPTRDGWRFLGWTPRVAEKVTGNAVYFATWEPLVDDVTYTVIYTDDVGRTAFEDQVYSNLKAGDPTPAYSGTPTRTGYEFIGWNPKVADKVTDDVVYFASWEPLPGTYTVTYSDGAGGRVFADKVTTDLKYGDATPTFDDTPMRDGWRFLGWTPAVAEKVTGNAVYFATWEPVTEETDAPTAHTVLFLPADQGVLNGRDKHTVPNGEYVPMIPEVEANEGYTFLEKWEVTEVNGDTDFIQVGDVLNETNISHLRITYDVTFKALYKAASTPTPTVAPTDTPTPTPASTATVKPTSTPIPQPIVTPKPYDPGYTYKFSFTKEWQGGIEDSIDWTLYDASGNVVHKKFNKKVVNEKEWSYEAWFATSVDYYLIENVPAGYKVRYENVGAHAGETDRLYNGGTIINYKVPQTGDQFNPWLWLGGILLGLGAVCGTIRIDRRKKTRQ